MAARIHERIVRGLSASAPVSLAAVTVLACNAEPAPAAGESSLASRLADCPRCQCGARKV